MMMIKSTYPILIVSKSKPVLVFRPVTVKFHRSIHSPLNYLFSVIQTKICMRERERERMREREREREKERTRKRERESQVKAESNIRSSKVNCILLTYMRVRFRRNCVLEKTNNYFSLAFSNLISFKYCNL